MNTRELGDIGVAQAIYYYTMQDYKVSIPNTESTRYDLLVEKRGQIYRVQCKTTHATAPSGVPTCELRTKGGNKSGSTSKQISADETDLVWISVNGVSAYEFPVEEVAGRTSINLGDSYQNFAVMGVPAYNRAEEWGFAGLPLGIILVEDRNL